MPTEEKVTRKLRAILSADVKGYSLLMANDEAYTIKKLEAYRSSMSELIRSHSGRVVDAVGDNLLAEFSSVVDAVHCAVEIQKDLQQKNEELPTDKRLEFRIGVNIGDVIQEGDRIYGNGVNVAARIEALAESGEICISRNAYSHVRDKLELGYEYLGEHSVKNIKRPVRVYKVLMNPEDAGKLIGDKPKPVVKIWIWATIVVAAVVITSIVILVYQNVSKPDFEPASVKKMAYPLPEKPSIAVLAFDNMTGEKTQEYFSDGLSEEIITALASVPELFVIARNSSFIYKGKPVKIQQISEELGVRYVLEGSVRKSGDKIRITVQLIDALKGHHLWAENFDRNIEDLFALQEEIAVNVITELRVKLRDDEKGVRIGEPCSSNLKAYLKYLKAAEHFRQLTPESIAAARRLIEEATELDPGYSCAYAVLGGLYRMDVYLGNTESPMKSFATAKKWYEKAIDVNPSNPGSQAGLAGILSEIGLYEQAIVQAEKALTIDSNLMMSNRAMGFALYRSGRSKEAVPFYEKALRLDPFSTVTLRQLGQAYFLSGQNEKAIETCNRLVDRTPQYLPGHLILASAYSAAGHAEEAKAAASTILKMNPKFTLEAYSKRLRFKNPVDKELIISNLRKAGLPEYPPGKKLPDKPSIAVLPFDNLSDDPEQGYFSDGISEDIITDLSKISGLIVIARNSSFSYKGKTIKVQQIGKELNVRYLLEGSVRKAGNQVRINAQLIDANSGHHLWADRYDGDMSDIFALQDQISRKIISALALKLTKSEQEFLVDKGTNNIQAYDEFLKGWQGYRLLTKDGFAAAKFHLENAVELDPDFTRGYAALAILYWKAVQSAAPELREGLGLNTPAAKMAAQAKPQFLLKKAMKKPTALAHGLMSQFYLFRYQHDEALAEIEKAISMDPNDPELYAWLSHILWLLGRSDEAIESAKMGMRLDPINPVAYLIQLGKAYIPDGDLNKSLHALERAKRLNPDLSGVTALSMSIIHGIQGKYDEARTVYEYFLKHRMYPVRDINALLLYFPFADPKKLDPIAKALIMAGAPGKPTDYYKILKENRIAGQNIKALLFGHKVTGISIFSGKELQWIWSKSGDFQFTAGTFQDQGKSLVEGDVIFLQYKKFMGGLPYGSTIYRNPDGSRNIKNQYLMVSDVGSITPVALIE